MAVTPLRLCTAFVPVAMDAVYTASNTVRIDAMVLTNADVALHTVSVHLVSNGGGADASNIVFSNQPLAPGETRRVAGAIGQVLRSGGTIRAVASTAGAVNIYASGVEIA